MRTSGVTFTGIVFIIIGIILLALTSSPSEQLGTLIFDSALVLLFIGLVIIATGIVLVLVSAYKEENRIGKKG